jgi:hypothetical protein
MIALKLKLFFLVLLWLLAGCGGSGSSGSAGDPLSPPPSDDGGTTPPSGQGTVVNYTLGLSAVGSSGTATVGANSTVTVTATLKNSEGQLIANQPVRFEEIKAAATDPPLVEFVTPVVNTSSEGIATTFLQTADTSVNRDVIIKGSTTIEGKLISSVSILRIVRSEGNYIKFITTKETTDPSGNLNLLEGTLEGENPLLHPSFFFPQLVTFQVLDKNGLNRTDVPVKLEVFRVTGEGCRVTLGNDETTETITTDDTGLGIFSTKIEVATPDPGTETVCSVIFKATTPDVYSATPKDLFSYGGYLVKLENTKL